jgi:hypothetical protein
VRPARIEREVGTSFSRRPPADRRAVAGELAAVGEPHARRDHHTGVELLLVKAAAAGQARAAFSGGDVEAAAPDILDVEVVEPGLQRSPGEGAGRGAKVEVAALAEAHSGQLDPLRARLHIGRHRNPCIAHAAARQRRAQQERGPSNRLHENPFPFFFFCPGP